MRKMTVVCVGLLVLFAAVAAAKAPSPVDTVANLRAFAKLYGYVRFFHPSDEASLIDWDRFAALGAGRVAGCADAKSLRIALTGLFGPLAPSAQVYGAGMQARTVKLPGDSATCRPVCWQHQGVGLQEPSAYSSRRTNRMTSADRAGRSVFQSADLPPGDSASGRRLRVRARVRVEGVEQGDEPVVFAAGTNPRENPMTAMARASSIPVSGAAWQDIEVEAPLAYGQTKAAIGVAASLSGTLWADDFEGWVSSGDSWSKLDLKDPGFEDSVSLEESPVWIYAAHAEKTEEKPFAGAKCLHVMAGAGDTAFAGSPKPGEFVDKPLDRGLSCRVPLCLWSRDEHTLPRADAASFERLKADVDAVNWDTLADPDLGVRLGDVVIVWSVLQHFYPYFDVVPANWDSALTSALEHARADKDRADFLHTLRLMAAALYDGHGSVTDPATRAWGQVPARLELVEGRVAVIAADSEAGLRKGDEVLEINGRPIQEAIAEQMRISSGSPQFRQIRSVQRTLRGPVGDTFRFLVVRGKDTVAASGTAVKTPAVLVPPDQGESIRQLAKGIWYVDLTRAPMPTIDSVMDRLARAKGVVFDLRGYPNGNHDVISHLLTGKEQRGEAWMWIPRITYPDHERIVGWDGIGWTSLQPKKPHITGKVVFLTDGEAASYAESFMGYIDGFKLAEIVGGPTAGTNGNINPIDLPGGYTFWWTGMKVTKFDGSQHHLIGIQPTVPLERTLAAVREGRDEYIEKALELIRGGQRE
ncbi:MAG: S41 family peptidase [candidate division WOR-3 bacterium]|nr:S41 family peptidase [candidate division WOR-3 bacterium]